MLTLSTDLLYPYLLIFSTGKKTFENMGRSIKKSGDSVSRSLNQANQSLAELKSIAINALREKKELKLLADHSIIRKMFAQCMEGAWELYDGVLGKCVNGYRWFVVLLVCGDIVFPWECKFALPKELASKDDETWLQIIQRIYVDIQNNFPKTKITIIADGAFATTAMVGWCTKNNIRAEMRMHKNRRVLHKGVLIKISEIKELIPKGRHFARTIKVIWHENNISITAQRRVNKHGDETIVYQIATYEAKPALHVKTYKQRWAIEESFRRCKQIFGLQDCASTSFEKQSNHAAAILLAYALSQLERINGRYCCIEDAIRALKSMNFNMMQSRLHALNQIFHAI